MEIKKDVAESEKLVVSLEELRSSDIAIAGGKNANLGELASFGMPVPGGFVVTAQAYRQFLTTTSLGKKIENLLATTSRNQDPAQLEEVSKTIRDIIEKTRIPDDLSTVITRAYDALCTRMNIKEIPVAIRSSATAEDLADASFAGQQETFLNVKGSKNVLEHVRKCWSSLFTPRAIFYRLEKGFPHEKVLMSVGVQTLVNPKSAGVIFTLNPTNGDITKVTIESAWGLGEGIVSGTITPDLFVVDKDSLEIVERRISTKNLEIVPSNHHGTVQKAPELDRRTAPSLTDDEIKHLAKLADTIESHFGKPQDIEFAVDGSLPFPKSVFIVQSRPETVWSFKKRIAEGMRAAPVLKGYGASPGMHFGKAKIVQTTAEAAKLLTKGDILVTRMTNPDWVPYMKIAGSIVTDDGGVTCHAAIVSRELGIPCIVGTREATRVMQTAQTYTVNAKSGTVFEGIVQSEAKEELEAKAAIPATATAPITATKIFVNLSIPEISDRVAKDTNADGVGLLRAEHMMLSVGRHPRLIIEEGGAEKMVESFADGIRQVAEAFHPRPVIYRFLDFKPDEFLGLPGGEKYEREAGHVGPNPMLGYRGCFRYVKEPDIFRLECRAMRKVRDEFGLKNVWAMIPFVRTINEFRTARDIMKEEGLVRNPDFKLWIMVEVPSTVLLIDQFIEEGLDGISFGTNDLCMLVLGIDRNDSIVQEIYDERNPAVLRAMSHVIRKCREKGVTTSVCGQAPSNYPEVVEFLVREGATSMSVNPDKVIETRHLVASIEQRIILDGFRGKTNGTQLSFKE